MKVAPANESPRKAVSGTGYDSDESSGIISVDNENNDRPVSSSARSSRKSKKKPVSKLIQQRNEVKAKVVKDVLDLVLPDIGAYDVDGTSRVRKESETGKFIVKWCKYIGCMDLDLHDSVLSGSIYKVRGTIKKLKKDFEDYKDLLNQYDDDGFTPLSLGAKINNPEIVEELLDAGAIPDMVDEVSGRTPLFYSILQKNHTISQLLLDNGANPNMPDFKCITPLMIAVSKNDLRHCQMLLRKNAELDVQDENGWTALHYGVMVNSLDCMQFLISEGADKNIKDMNKRKVLHLAKYLERGNCIAMLSANSKIL
ncbi:hypothetical protein EON65_19070 [archaeon]|nr:MAG: hypothetical protein EON65_19070 [archaeon]